MLGARPSEGSVLAALAARDADRGPSERKRRRVPESEEERRRQRRKQQRAGPGSDAEDEGDEGQRVTMLKLKAVEGPFRGVKFEIDPDGAKVGRMAIPTPTFAKKIHELHLPDNDVSRKHAKIEWDDAAGAYRIRDLNSTNGVRVNGVRIAAYAEAALAAGDRLELGQSVFDVRTKQATVYKWQKRLASRREVAHRKAEVKVPRLSREERAAIPRREVALSALTPQS
eukprot:COSAG06_NODE_23009_length_705_cov_1.506601_1_plen_226_part_01